MSNTTADRRFAARVFAVLAGTLLGAGLALVEYGMRLPSRGPIGKLAFLLVALGAIVMLTGGVLGVTSMAMRRAHRVGHLFQWVLVPALIAFAVGWAWLRSLL